MAQDANGKANGNDGSHLGFFVAMLAVVAIGGGTFWYLNNTVFSPVQQQMQTAAASPGGSHPGKSRGNKSDAPKSDQPAASASEAGR